MPRLELMQGSSRRTIDISTAALGKLVGLAVLVWLWLHLWQLVLLILVAVLLAVALDPLVVWMTERRVSRPVGATFVGLALIFVLAAFFTLTGSSLAGQAHVLGERLLAFEQEVLKRLPPSMVKLLPTQPMTPDSTVSVIAGNALYAGRALLGAMLVVALADC